MTHPQTPQPPLDLYTDLSSKALRASLDYLSTEILSGTSAIGDRANYAYKIYAKACCLEQFVRGTKLKKLSRREFQALVDPMAQSIWAYGDRDHAHLFTR